MAIKKKKKAPSKPRGRKKINGNTLNKLRNQERWFNAFEQIGQPIPTCRAAGVDPSTYYAWVEKDEKFNARLAEAREAYTQLLEVECDARARGIGNRKPSDLLMIFRLKAMRPEYYANRDKLTGHLQGNFAHQHSGVVVHEVVDQIRSDPLILDAIRSRARDGDSIPGDSSSDDRPRLAVRSSSGGNGSTDNGSGNGEAH